ncbi:MAG TPA: ATP-binding protein [Actinomycetes bacterium]|jgi:signal transduction histidine kinase|nr:ATP-binding protein [Actinomycetes bacterium]
MDTDEIRPLTLFDGLDDTQLHELIDQGREVAFTTGDEVFREGGPAEDWWVLLEGSVDLVRHVGREETVLGVMDVPGRWAGGFRAWDEHGAYLATGRATSDGRFLCVPAPALRDWTKRWFPFGEHLVEGVFRTVRGFEAVTRQREALVALGTLAAGLAHEINNPAAAATRAADALEETCTLLLSALNRLAAGSITAEQFLALDSLRRDIGLPPAVVDPPAVARREEVLSDWLARRGIEADWLIAPPLALAGVDVSWCDQVAGVLDGVELEAGLQWVAGTLSTAALIAELKSATSRVSDLVSAVRSYSQLDRASVQRIDVVEGLESTLVMLRHKTPAGVSVVRDYGADVPAIEAIPGELNQVWTNLVDNALDAMDGAGILRISTRADGTGVLVEVADTGGGLAEDVRDHAFEPFFTTKGVGKGTGLGLDISRRIVVDRHAGEIAIESREGETVATVRLPSGVGLLGRPGA